MHGTVVERGVGGDEVARVGQAVGADRAQLGQAERGAVVLADVAAHRGAGHGRVDLEQHAARQQHDLARCRVQHAQLGGDA